MMSCKIAAKTAGDFVLSIDCKNRLSLSILNGHRLFEAIDLIIKSSILSSHGSFEAIDPTTQPSIHSSLECLP